jgi:hypothetical protein
MTDAEKKPLPPCVCGHEAHEEGGCPSCGDDPACKAYVARMIWYPSVSTPYFRTHPETGLRPVLPGDLAACPMCDGNGFRDVSVASSSRLGSKLFVEVCPNCDGAGLLTVLPVGGACEEVRREAWK